MDLGNQISFARPPGLDPVYQFYGNGGSRNGQRLFQSFFKNSESKSTLSTRPTVFVGVVVVAILLVSLLATALLFSVLDGNTDAAEPTVDEPEWSQWGEWSTCSLTCNGGITQRPRQCIGESGHSCEGSSTEYTICNEQQCPEWSQWGEWSTCSLTCNGGITQRPRQCVGEGGQSCEGSSTEYTICNEQQCPEWSQWGEWSTCSLTCNGGITQRPRQCVGEGGQSCEGSSTEYTICNEQQCPEWSQWGEWSTCSLTCNGGITQRPRQCVGEGGQSCEGSSTEYTICNEQQCPPTPTTQPPITLNTECPLFWTRFNDNCYRLFGDSTTWIRAEEHCSGLSFTGTSQGHLVSIHSQEEADFIAILWDNSIIKSPQLSCTLSTGFNGSPFTAILIGLNDRDSEGTFVWTDGSPTDYMAWGSGQPNDYGGQQDCTHWGHPSADYFWKPWNDLSCEDPTLFPYVCKLSLIS